MNTLDLMSDAAIDIANPLLPTATRIAATFTFVSPLAYLNRANSTVIAHTIRTYGNEMDTLLQLIEDPFQNYRLRERIMDHSLRKGIDNIASSTSYQRIHLKRNATGTSVTDYFSGSTGSIAHHVTHAVSFQNVIDTLLRIAEHPGGEDFMSSDCLNLRKMAIETMNSIYGHAVHAFGVSIDRSSIYDRLTNIALNTPYAKIREAAMAYDQPDLDTGPKPSRNPSNP